jgi:hypothetical protein
MTDDAEKSRSLLQLALSLRLAAQRLAESADRMQQVTTHQRDYLERLSLLRDRVVELLSICRRLTDSPGAAPTPQPAAPIAGAAPAPPPLPTSQAPRTRLPASAFVEFSNWQEFEKFRRLPPISEQELASCDMDELIRRLSEARPAF